MSLLTPFALPRLLFLPGGAISIVCTLYDMFSTFILKVAMTRHECFRSHFSTLYVQ